MLSNATASTEIYTLSLHDALPICAEPFQQREVVSDDLRRVLQVGEAVDDGHGGMFGKFLCRVIDRKSTRLNSSHVAISYAVFCLKKKISRAISPTTPTSGIVLVIS